MQHVHEDHVHVVVIAGEVAVGVEHLLLAGEMEVGRVVPGADGGIGGGDGGEVLALEPVAEVLLGAVVVAEGVEDVGAAPSGEHGAPGHAAVQDTLRVRVPDGFGGDGDGGAEGVEVLVGGVEGEGCGEGFELGAAGGEGGVSGLLRPMHQRRLLIDADVEGVVLDRGRADEDRLVVSFALHAVSGPVAGAADSMPRNQRLRLRPVRLRSLAESRAAICCGFASNMGSDAESPLSASSPP